MADPIVTLIENARRKVGNAKHDGGWFAASAEAVLALAAERDEAVESLTAARRHRADPSDELVERLWWYLTHE